MANPHVIVGHIDRLDPPPSMQLEAALPEAVDQGVTVHFEDAQIAHLRAGDRFEFHRRTLESFHRVGLPVYTEVEPDTRNLTRLLIPTTGRVSRVFRQKPGGDAIFHLDSSAMPLTLPSTHVNYEEYLHLLRDAELEGTYLLVTHDERGEALIDIRKSTNPPPPASLDFVLGMPASESLMARSVTLDRARDLFEAAADRGCGVTAPPTSVCIPFLYPMDGCHGRAHAMCALIASRGEQAFKVWNFCTSVDKPLLVKTRNSPVCQVEWGFHVAVAMQVQNSPGDPQQIYVLDPALFTGPVPVEVWHTAQGAPDSCLAYTSPEPFLPPGKATVEFDPDGRKTAKELTRCRGLLEQSISQNGAPPYRDCR